MTEQNKKGNDRQIFAIKSHEKSRDRQETAGETREKRG